MNAVTTIAADACEHSSARMDAATPPDDRVTLKHNDATIIGDLEAPEVDALLNQAVVIGTTDRAPRVSGAGWEHRPMTWAKLVDMLSHHPESKDKGGNALFFAESELTQKRRNGVDFCFKLKARIKTVFAAAIDVDGGCAVEEVVDRVRALGLFAVIYTTHSHTTKGGEGSDRFRVILPLSVPFDMGAGEARKGRYDLWEAAYVGLCNALVPEGGGWDFTASRPSQLMYAPARPKGAAFKHFIIAGTGLDLSTVEPGDASPYHKRGPSGIARGGVAASDAPAVLSDGFDLLAWHGDHGAYFLLSTFLEMIGWDVLSNAGDGFEAACPNAAAHTSGAGTCWACDGPDATNGAVIFCHHSHCADLRTCDFLRLLEPPAALPEGFDSMSALLCSEMFYPDDVTVEREIYIDAPVTLAPLKTPVAVARAFAALSAHASEDHFAALYGGVELGGNRAAATAKLAELVKGAGRFSANDLKRLQARGTALLKDHRKAYGATLAERERAELEEALRREDLANPSMDPAEPLGDNMQAALATLGKRYAVADLDGKFRVVRKPDLEAFRSETDSTIAVYRMDDFVNLHLDRQVRQGDDLVNPAKLFLETEKRKSGIVFAPPPHNCGKNDFNMYQGRKLKAQAGTWATLEDFIFRVICNNDVGKFDWLMLWMAHMVQLPGEKPGTAVICRGEGGTGKGTFGGLLAKLAAPHFKQLEKEAHVIGQFAGEHLSKCILAVVNEAVFGASPRVSSELKALVDSTTLQVEAKGMNVVTVPSFIRLYIDSNDALPILIEGNGSERRYFVIETSTAEKQNLDYFAKVRAAIEGDEMAALLDHLERYEPASAGLTWADVRTAPETAERRLMGWHSMRPPMRRLLDILRDGTVELPVNGIPETFAADAAGLRVPVPAFREYIAAAGDKRRAEDSDVAGMFAKLFPGVELLERRGRVGRAQNDRWWLFPVAVLGDGAEPAGLDLPGAA